MIALDASFALAWSHLDEATSEIDSVMARVAVEGGIVPALWPIEVANGLEMAVRRKRIDAAARDRVVANLHRLPITIEAIDPQRVWVDAAALAARYRLTVYDAVYFEVAVRRRLPFATLDKELIAAARAEKVAVLP